MVEEGLDCEKGFVAFQAFELPFICHAKVLIHPLLTLLILCLLVVLLLHCNRFGLLGLRLLPHCNITKSMRRLWIEIFHLLYIPMFLDADQIRLTSFITWQPDIRYEYCESNAGSKDNLLHQAFAPKLGASIWQCTFGAKCLPLNIWQRSATFGAAHFKPKARRQTRSTKCLRQSKNVDWRWWTPSNAHGWRLAFTRIDWIPYITKTKNAWTTAARPRLAVELCVRDAATGQLRWITFCQNGYIQRARICIYCDLFELLRWVAWRAISKVVIIIRTLVFLIRFGIGRSSIDLQHKANTRPSFLDLFLK